GHGDATGVAVADFQDAVNLDLVQLIVGQVERAGRVADGAEIDRPARDGRLQGDATRVALGDDRLQVHAVGDESDADAPGQRDGGVVGQRVVGAEGFQDQRVRPGVDAAIDREVAVVGADDGRVDGGAIRQA